MTNKRFNKQNDAYHKLKVNIKKINAILAEKKQKGNEPKKNDQNEVVVYESKEELEQKL